MGIGDHAFQQGEIKKAGFNRIAVAQWVGQRARAGDAAAIHRAVQIFPLDCQTGTGAAQRFAGFHMVVQCFGQRRATPITHIARLVTPGDEDAIGVPNCGDDLGVTGGIAIFEDEGFCRLNTADFVEEFFADLARQRCPQDHDMAVAGFVHEPVHGIEIAIATAHQQQARLHFAGGLGFDIPKHVVINIGRLQRCVRQPHQHRCQQQRATGKSLHRHTPSCVGNILLDEESGVFPRPQGK